MYQNVHFTEIENIQNKTKIQNRIFNLNLTCTLLHFVRIFCFKRLPLTKKMIDFATGRSLQHVSMLVADRSRPEVILHPDAQGDETRIGIDQHFCWAQCLSRRTWNYEETKHLVRSFSHLSLVIASCLALNNF